MTKPTGGAISRSARMGQDARKKLANFFAGKNKKGAGLLEYGLVIGLIVIVSISAVISTGGQIKSIFITTSNTFIALDVANGNENPVDIAIGIDGQPLDLTPFVIEVSGSQATIYPMGGGAIEVDWGNATANANCGQSFTAGSAISCNYPAMGEYQIAIEGEMTEYGHSDGIATNAAITRVTQWGNTGLTDLSYAFYGANNLIDVPTTLPASVTSLENAFHAASALNDPDIGRWKVSNVTRLDATFARATNFGVDLSNWDTANVTNMSDLFMNTSFNADISNWKTGKVTQMVRMFADNTVFAGDVSSWDTSKVANMTAMFRRASAFSSDISQWDVSSATNMTEMFQDATNQNSDLSGWCVSNIGTEPGRFADRAGFEADLAKRPDWGNCP